MNEPLSRLAYLFGLYAENACTEAERKEFLALVAREENAAALNQLIENAVDNSPADLQIAPQKADRLYEAILQTANVQKRTVTPVRNMFSFKRIAAAAIVVLMAGTGAWYAFFHKEAPKTAVIAARPPLLKVKNDVPPGSNKATLILGDGSTIVLDSAHNGQLARQGSSKIVNQDGHIIYHPGGNDEMVVYNTMTTPRGGQYQLVLPDGTKVWLNAASSIKYPTAFTGKQRTVELTGEAYFEVAKNVSKPFIVQSNDVAIKVLGTHFNVMAYKDEDAMKTTLLEGAVEVSNGTQRKLLAPGQQAQVNNSHTIVLVKDADIEKAIAWKSGFFKFNNTDIKALMREISRWYDIDVVYQINDYSEEFGGRISRNLNLHDLIALLEGNNIHHYKIEGRKLTVLP